MKRRLLLGFLSVTTFVLVVLEVPLGINFARHERQRLVADVERDATVIASFAEDALENSHPQTLTPLVKRYATQTGARVIVVNAKGLSVADSAPPDASPEDFATRPEIRAALAGGVASGSRYSKTLGTSLVYVAVPVASGGNIHGAVRLTYPSGALDARVAHNWLALGGLGISILLAAAAIGWAVARSLARPVGALEAAASELAAGHLDARAPDARTVPELRSLSQAFNDMAARIEQLVSSQQEFVADASHELRTPLTSLQLRLENVQDALGDQEAEDIDGALRDVRRLRRIVDGLLALARMEAGSAARETIDVSAALRDRAGAWEAVAEQRRVKLEVHARDGLACAAVPGTLERILDNLISNALDASPPSTVVRMRAERAGDQIEIHVVDQGPGMTEAERARAFDRFWRADPARGGGSGLGLPIVRQLAITNGGSVSLAGADGGGLDVSVRLHAAQQRDAVPA